MISSHIITCLRLQMNIRKASRKWSTLMNRLHNTSLDLTGLVQYFMTILNSNRSLRMCMQTFLNLICMLISFYAAGVGIVNNAQSNNINCNVVGWKHLFDATWRNFGSRFNAILQSLARNRDLVDREANSFDILESKAFRHRLYEDVERREAEMRGWQLRDTLTWLDLQGQDREQGEMFERRSKDRSDGTCQWILRNPKISMWLDEYDPHLFVWLRGKPGSGKQ